MLVPYHSLSNPRLSTILAYETAKSALYWIDWFAMLVTFEGTALNSGVAVKEVPGNTRTKRYIWA